MEMSYAVTDETYVVLDNRRSEYGLTSHRTVKTEHPYFLITIPNSNRLMVVYPVAVGITLGLDG